MARSTPHSLESWRALSHFRRCRIVASARHEIAAACDELVLRCQSAQRTDPVETVASELISLCAALKFLGRRGGWILRTRRYGMLGRPSWLLGVRSRVQRVARGDVLVLSPWNYPILLAGVQVAQALAGGNRVFLKPAPGCESVTQCLVDAFYRVGISPEVLRVLSSDAQSAIDRIDCGVDLVVLTGSSTTGRAVLRQCAEKLTPCIMELSGCDAVIVGPGANLARVAKAIRFGLMLNGGATCIGPRRILVPPSSKAELVEHLRSEFRNAEAVTVRQAAMASVHDAILDTRQRGGVNLLTQPGRPDRDDMESFDPKIFDKVAFDWPIATSDLFAPVCSLITYESEQEAIEIVNRCCCRLSASVFGGVRWASRVADQLNTGSVVINDLIYPTADPRLPFGGRGNSGFGVTRGVQGLLDMTVPRVVCTHCGPVYLHLAPRRDSDYATLAGLLTLTHSRIGRKWTALQRWCGGVKFKAPPQSLGNEAAPPSPPTE
jgi:acyl-CoA reductase-like NAD-dependent aldehyde dehydrogenase